MPGTDGDTNPNLMLMIGQLLEATKAASEGIKNLTDDLKDAVTRVQVAAQSVEILEVQVDRLSDVVLAADNPGNLILSDRAHRIDIVTLRDGVRELREAVSDLKESVAAIQVTDVVERTEVTTTRANMSRAAIWIGWIVTTAIALYAAITGGK